MLVNSDFAIYSLLALHRFALKDHNDDSKTGNCCFIHICFQMHASKRDSA